MGEDQGGRIAHRNLPVFQNIWMIKRQEVVSE
jgi:hypothetical protein